MLYISTFFSISFALSPKSIIFACNNYGQNIII
jgi:hypothetical protein